MRSSTAGNKTGGMREPARARKSAAMLKIAAMSKSAGMSDEWMSVIGVAAIDESRAARNVPVMVVYDVVSVPIGSPVVPPPAEASEHADSNSQAERNSWP